MMPEEWPLAASAADQTGRARSAGRDRLSTVRVDFFLDPAERLTEQERALMTAMLHCIVGDIADALRSALPNVATPANDEGNLALMDLLSSAGLLNRAGLERLLRRRADEERIATGARARAGRREARVVQGLVSHADGAVAAAAMALIIARGRRRDRFGQCLLHFDDLPPEEARALAHILCAGLRGEIVGLIGGAEADRALAEAAARVASSHDPGNGIDALTMTLVRLLDEEGELNDDLLVGAAMEGEITFLANALSRRSGIGGQTAVDELLSGDRRAMILLRAAGVSRHVAASVLAGVGDLLGMPDPGQAIDVYDRLSAAEVEDARIWLTSDPVYRLAVGRLDSANG
jgi:hypothetical protein